MSERIIRANAQLEPMTDQELEPLALSAGDKDAVVPASVAISLRRIADVLEGVDGNIGLIEALDAITQAITDHA
jgi:hypothetical protein